MRFLVAMCATAVLLAGCDKVKEFEKKITGDDDKQQASKSSSDQNQTSDGNGGQGTKSDGSNTGSGKTKGDNGGTEKNPDKGEKTNPNPKPKPNPKFADVDATERSAVEALDALGAKMKIENGSVVELSARHKMDRKHVGHIFKLTQLRMLDLANTPLRDDMLREISKLRKLQFVDLTRTAAGTQTFVELMKIPSFNFAVFDGSQIDLGAIDALRRDRRKLTLCVRGLSEIFTDDEVLQANEQFRGRVTFATDSGVLPAKIIKFPKVAGVQTGGIRE